MPEKAPTPTSGVPSHPRGAPHPGTIPPRSMLRAALRAAWPKQSNHQQSIITNNIGFCIHESQYKFVLVAPDGSVLVFPLHKTDKCLFCFLFGAQNRLRPGSRSAGMSWDLRLRAANHAKCTILVFQSDRIPFFSIFRSGSFLLFPISAKLVGGYMGKAEQTGLQTKKNQTKKENESIDRLLRQTRLSDIKGNHAREQTTRK
jgi:hypothetical protein